MPRNEDGGAETAKYDAQGTVLTAGKSPARVRRREGHTAMHLNRLRALIAVIEHGGFSQGARALGVSQPAISQQIKALETDLGATLIERHTDPVRPTEAGAIVYRQAKKMLQLWDEAVRDIRRLQDRSLGRLSFGASTIPATYLLPPLISRFREQHPRIDVSMEVADSAVVTAWVLEGRVDIGAVGAPPDDSRLVHTVLGEDELLPLAPVGHPWADGREVEPRLLTTQPLVQRERGSGTRRAMEEALEGWGIDPDAFAVAAELGSTEAVVAAVEAGLGISFVSKWAARPALTLGRVAAFRVKAPPVRRRFYLITRKSRRHDPLVAAFFELCAAAAPVPT